VPVRVCAKSGPFPAPYHLRGRLFGHLLPAGGEKETPGAPLLPFSLRSGEKVAEGRMRGAFRSADAALPDIVKARRGPTLPPTGGNIMRRKTDHARQRQLRRDQTEAERVLWQHLRDRRLLGWKFRRQHRIGPYFADFVCVEGCLIVELDGSQHLTQQRHDDARMRFLETQGFRVLRFWNDDVLRDTEAVLATIAIALAPHPPSAPSPRRRGEGKSEAVIAPFSLRSGEKERAKP